MNDVNVKLRSGQYMKPVTLMYRKDRIFVKFGFDKNLQAEIKSMEGAKWHGYEDPPIKQWSIANSLRNKFALEYLQGLNPFEVYDVPLKEVTTKRPCFPHQTLMIQESITRQYKIIAAEMGTGKTLHAIELMEAVRDLYQHSDWWFVAPKSVLKAIKMELKKWDAKVIPTLMTYDEHRERVKSWASGTKPPRGIVYDEASKLKTPTSQRSQAAKHIAHAIRTEHGMNGFVILMTGTPAPKSPLDWWHLCEVACPGFLKEGNIDKFAARLSLTVQRQSISGGAYPQRITWWDDEKKCKACGKFESDPIHGEFGLFTMMTQKNLDPLVTPHKWEASINEIAKLYKRLQGLVTVIFKKDVLKNLPDKVYQIVQVEPAADTLRAAKLIANTSPNTITALTRLRELSDGFQYADTPTGRYITCGLCHGTATVKEWVVRGTDEIVREDTDVPLENRDQLELPCGNCTAGQVEVVERTAIQVPCPKDAIILDLLDEVEDTGRLVVYAGFEGSIDRLTALVLKEGWAVCRVDGRGWYCVDENLSSLITEDCLIGLDAKNPEYQRVLEAIPKLVFIGNPGAAGMGLTFTASPIIAYYSNSFNGEDRFQSEDRGHRPGMDENRGLRIVDIFHLPSDKRVLDNLKQKKNLQDMSLGVLKDAINNPDSERTV